MSSEKEIVADIMRNAAPDGTRIAYMEMAMRKLATLIETAHTGQYDRVHDMIESIASEAPEYLEQIVFGCALILGPLMHRGTGRSLLPIVQAFAKRWPDTDASSKIWRPN